MVSVPSPVAVPLAILIVTTFPDCEKLTVSVPTPPCKVLLDESPSIISSPSEPMTCSIFLTVSDPTPVAVCAFKLILIASLPL